MKCWESSETRFPKVWGRTEPCSRGKRPFKVRRKKTFLRFSLGFCGFGGQWTSKSASSSNFEWPLTLRMWLRSAWNFGKTRFRRFPTFHFSTPKEKICRKFSIKIFAKNFFDGKLTNCLFLRSYGFLDVIGRCASKSYPQSFDFQLSTTFGGGVKEIVSIFAPDFRPKMTSRLLVFWLEDTSVLARRHYLFCPG